MAVSRLALVLAIASALFGRAAMAEEAARLEATLHYDGKTLPLTKMLVVQNGNEEGLEDGPRLRIYLSDGDIPLGVAGGAGTLRAKAYARDAGINGVVILADPSGKSLAGATYLLNAPGLEPGAFASSNSTDAFKELHVAASRVTGSVAADGEAFTLDASFDAPLTAYPVTSDLTGKAATNSAPVKALIAYHDALVKGDMAAMARVATAEQLKGIGEFRAQAGETAFRAAVKQQGGGAAVAKAVKRLVVRGSTASVVLKGGEVAELTLEGDGWKVSE